MNATVTPAYRPTANCIWLSFRSSGKRHLILTGSRGSGKTTLLRALLPHSAPGVTTWAEPQKAVWLCENGTQNKARIGQYDASLPGSANKMILCPAGFLQLGIPALERCMNADSEWVTIDEIGYLESGCSAYCDTIRRLMQHKRLIAAVRKQEMPFLQEITTRNDVFLVDLDKPFGNSACVIMASGMGKRFGGNKLMADFRGQPMITHALDATEGLFDQVVVVTRHKDVAALCHKRGVQTVLHAFPQRSDTVRLGIEFVGTAASGCMFLSGDQPLLGRDTVAALLLCAASDPASIWRTVHQGTPGAPVWFPARFFDELHTLPEGKGGSWVIRQHPQLLRMLEVDDPHELMDVDSPDDLARLLNP